MLEWAIGGSLSSVFKKYRKVDARIGPHVLQKIAYQVSWPAHVIMGST